MSPATPPSPPPSPPSPHDHLFKHVFSDPLRAADLAKSSLSPALAAQIDWSHLEATRGHYVDSELHEKQTDLLFIAPLTDGREALVYLLFEHQSQPDTWMAFRILVYMVRIWEDWRREHPEAKRLPAIVPIVVHQGPQGWTTARKLSELIDLTPEQLPLFTEHLPELRLTIDDLSRHTEEQLRQRSQHALLTLALLLLRDLPASRDALAAAVRWLDLFAEVSHDPASLGAIEALMRYILGVSDVDYRDLITLIRPHISERQASDMITTAQRLFNEGHQKGREEGQVQALLRQIAKRYAVVPSEEVRRRVEGATSEERERWLERIFEAETVEELLL